MAGQAVGALDAPPPLWALDLLTLHAGVVARQFVLHFNITDFVIGLAREDLEVLNPSDPPRRTRTGAQVGEPLAFRSYLHAFLRDSRYFGCQAIYTYSLAGGLIADEDREQRNGGPLQRNMQSPAWRRLFDTLAVAHSGQATQGQQPGQNGQPQEGREVDELPDEPPEVFKLLGHLLRQRHMVQGTEKPVAVIIDYAEKLMPVGVADGRSVVEQLVAVEVAQRWAIDSLIRQTNNVVILLTSNIGQLAANIHASGSGTRTIRVPLPDEHERAAYIQYLMSLRSVPERVALAQLDTGNFESDVRRQVENLTTMTQGMRLCDIDNLNRRVIMQCTTLRLPLILKKGDVQAEKEQVIQAQSGELLEVMPRTRTFDEIGGLAGLKKYLQITSDLMKLRSRSPRVPSGLLLAGPPGTGKTIIAEALATASSFNLVKMRNIQDRWVGSSERNLDLVINLLKDLYPVIVFIDEIDQAAVRRDLGQSGDSGVSGRMFARILEEMSNAANRGRILWIAATNRPDQLDAALLRRFDRVVPLLVPDYMEACRIFETMPSTINKYGDRHISVRYARELQPPEGMHTRSLKEQESDLERRFGKLAQRTVERNITGAGIENIVRHAYDTAALRAGGDDQEIAITRQDLEFALIDYKSNQDPEMYDLQSLLAIQACNYGTSIPLPLPNRYPFTEIVERIEGYDLDGVTYRIPIISVVRLNSIIREMRGRLKA